MKFLAGFDPIVFSCEVGYRKPERRIYEYVVEQVGVPASQVGFIDDERPRVSIYSISPVLRPHTAV